MERFSKSQSSDNVSILYRDGRPSLCLRDTDRSRSGPISGPISQSLKSNRSMRDPIDFKQKNQSATSLEETYPELQPSDPDSGTIFKKLEERILSFVQTELNKLQEVLTAEEPESLALEEEDEAGIKDAFLKIALSFLKRMEQDKMVDRLHKRQCASKCQRELKSDLRQRFSHVFEGVPKAGDSAPLTQIYTELYITEGGASEVNQEHEVRHMETTSRRSSTTETTITFEDIFKSHPHSPEQIRFVLTKGVAGVGKTVLTQKFSLDWAEGQAHQDLHLLFPFTFRELNVLRDTQFSLVGLLHHFFSPAKNLCSFQQLQMLFIFDGLDECRLPLDFSGTQDLTDPTESASVHVLLVNLIRGSLLPSARLWITTRHAAANQIPLEYISMVTEVRGFIDPQKEQYFRKRFRNKATAVISHIKSIRSLYIMCHIPVFCWILSTVLQKLLEQTEEPELPRTLTQMYIHFLVVQAKVQNIKYHQGSGADLHWTPETREMVWSLGKLAFTQLQKGNLIFYEYDLEECGLNVAAASMYSGVFTQIFREEPGLYQDKVYCFIHLSLQEFLAALHVHHTFYSSGRNLLQDKLLPRIRKSYKKKPGVLYRSAVDQALQSPNGHLDLFLRFLLGLSLSTNQKLLQGLLTYTGSEGTNQVTVEYIKQKLDEEGLSAERSLNLLHCLNELNDHSLVVLMQWYMRGGGPSIRYMSPAHWSALSFLLLSSDLKEFDLRKYQASETALLGLLPVVRASTKALLIGCDLSPHSCGPLASVLSSSSLTHLDLSDNQLKDSGVELLCSGLMSTSCKLETLRLSGCLVSERGGAALASALSSAPSHLRKLDLSYNHPGPSAELLTALQDNPNCSLQSVRLDPAGERWMVPGLRKYSCEISLDQDTAHRKLLLSSNRRGVTVTYVEKPQYPDHKDRFTDWPQVLSCIGLRGRCYWEVEWSGSVSIAVSYRGIRRRGRGRKSRFGYNDQSWSLKIRDRDYFVCHNGKTFTSGIFSSYRGAVFLDFEAGVLSFYEAFSDGKLLHLHKFSCSFSEPLFAGFGVWFGSNVTLINLNAWHGQEDRPGN